MISREEMQARKALPADVPCGSCRACCKQDRITLSDAEAAKFAWHQEGPDKVLDRKPGSTECLYLTAKGCGVHADAPMLCRQFDCRILFLTTPKDKRRIRIIQNPTMREVYDAGKRRADTLNTGN